jgi:hypothetical protein
VSRINQDQIKPITKGGGTITITAVEIDFGSSATRTKVFTIIDSNVTLTSNLMIVQSGVAAPGRQADENEMDPILFSAYPGSGQFTLYANALEGPVSGVYTINYIIG